MIGHNSVAALLDDAEALASVVDMWRAKVPEIRDAEEAGHALDLEARMRVAISRAEDARKEEKRPHMDAAAEVDKRYKPIGDLLSAAIEPLVALRKGWLRLEQARIDAEAAAMREVAKQAHREAEAAREAAGASGSLLATADANLAAKAADDAYAAAQAASKRKAQVVSASGGTRAQGLRSTWAARLVNFPLACRTYYNHPDVVAVLERLASAEARGGKREISGFEVYDR